MSETETVRFPADFLWGAGTSAYQIEGSPLADGAGPSIWHRFCHTPGRVRLDQTGDVACDHYRRYPEDVALMRRLGLRAYRFSVAWSRVLPEGRGAVNARGLDFYERLVDLLLENGIAPFVTLYHWDLPAALDDRGGWLNPDVAGWFAEYANVMVRALADRVPHWTTLNEPWVVTDAGYVHGVHAPGHRNIFEGPIVARNLLRAHGAGVQAARAAGCREIGLVVNLEPKEPASDRKDDLESARLGDAYMNRQFLDPVFRGTWPEEMETLYGEAWSPSTERDLRLMQQPIDFLGINYYKRAVTAHDPRGYLVPARDVLQTQSTYTQLGWETHAPALVRVLGWVKERYGDVPLYITENGAAFYDPPRAQRGRVEDPLRREYLRDHLLALHEARRQGVDVRGYFVWSLLDNFEWGLGYGPRLGIVHVDYETQERTLKDSAAFYREVIATQGAALGEADSAR